MNLLIFGASGRTGQELVRQALEQKHVVTAYVRHPEKLRINGDQLRVCLGDVMEYEKVEEALDGCDAVISALGAASPFRYDRSVVEGMRNIVKAMERKGIRRLIYLSAMNVVESRKNAGLVVRILSTSLLRTETAGHEDREQIIKNSKLDWTFVRPGKLSNGGLTRRYRSGGGIRATGALAQISRADVADYLLKQLTDRTWLGKATSVRY